MIETEKKRVEKEVTICVQLEDGTRVDGSFPPSATLRDIIEQLCPESDKETPVVVYMRSTLSGDALDSSSLKSLGLTSGGRALFRLIHTDPESLKVQANVSKPLPQRPKEQMEEDKPRFRASAEPSSSGVSINLQDIKRVKQEDRKREDLMEVVEDEIAKNIEPLADNASLVTIEQPKKCEPETIEPLVNILDERGTIIFSLDALQKSSYDLPDSFFDLTEADVKKLYRDLKNNVEAYANKPLMTEALRKLEENKKILNQLSIYKSCAIRVQMPNRYVIQTKFSTVEKIQGVKEFLKKYLINPELTFDLCKYKLCY